MHGCCTRVRLTQITRQQRQLRLTSIQSHSVVVIIKIARCVTCGQVLRGVTMVTEDWSPISDGNFVSFRARAVRSVRFINSRLLRATVPSSLVKCRHDSRLASLELQPRHWFDRCNDEQCSLYAV